MKRTNPNTNTMIMPSLNKLVPSFFLSLVVVISIISRNDGLTMRMIPINSPHLNIVPKQTTMHQRLEFFYNISLSRLYNNHKNDLSPSAIQSPLLRAKASMFVTQLSLGEGNDAFYSPYLLLDIGSEITWVQCEGCDPCFQVNGRNFAYRKSSSFKRVSVYDEMCISPEVTYEGSCGLSCKYGIVPPFPHVRGLFGRENFYFKNSRTNNIEVHQGLVFGCGLQNENIHFGLNNGPQNIISGVFGLNTEPRSFLTQLDAQTHGKFSYCLPPPSQLPLTESTIYLGDDAQIHGDANRQVQTMSMHNDYYYYLPLSGISVNGKRLPIDPSVFEHDENDDTKGFVIDTGTPYTMLARSAYNPLREAIQKFFLRRYGWLPRPPGGTTLDLCYSKYPNMDGRIFPYVTLHFSSDEQSGEIDMVLTKDQLFIDGLDFSGNDQGICLMVIPIDNPSYSILGAFQQVNSQFLFDVHNRRLSFVPQNCLQYIP